MHTFSVIAELLTTAAYAVAAFMYIMAYARNTAPYTTLRWPVLLTSIIIQIIFIGSVSADLHHCLVTNGMEVIELLAFIIAFIYVVLERSTKSQASGVFIIPAVFVLQLVPALLRKVNHDISPLYGTVAMNLHVTTALFGYAALALAGAYGGMYLLLFRSIKRSTFGTAFERFPSLEHLEQMSVISVRFGLAFLFVAIAVGLFWLPLEVPNFSYGDPKLLTTVVLWIVYSGGLLAYRTLRWEARRLMQLTLYGFLAALLSLTLINIVFHGVHQI